VEQPDASLVTFTYNSDHWRVAREDGFGITQFQFDKNNLLAELDDSHVVQVQYTNEPNEYGNVISQHTTADGESQFYAFDAPGSAIRLTDATMVVTDEYAYDAWGQALATSGTTHNPIRYIGKLGYYLDQELGTYHVRRRQYDQILARFRSEDPIRQDGGDNLYLYGGNDPVDTVDPEGLDWWPKPIVIDTSRGPKGWGAWPLWYGTVPQEITYTRLRGSYGQRSSAELILADLRELQKNGAKVDMDAAIAYRNWLNEKITVTEMSDAEFQRNCRQAQEILIPAADIGAGFIPIFNDIRDVVEVLTSRNVITGEELTTLDKALTVLAAILPLVSGPILRSLGRPVIGVLQRLQSSMQRLLQKLRSQVNSGNGDIIQRAIENLTKNLTEIAKILDEKLPPSPQLSPAGGGIRGLDTTCPTRPATCPVDRPTAANSSKIDGLGGAVPDKPKFDAPSNSIPQPGTPEWAKPWSESWTRPTNPRWRIPKNGNWSGQEGHSYFIPDDPAALGIKPGEVIPFRQGRPDFSQWTRNLKGELAPKTTFTSKVDLTGTEEDFPRMWQALADQYNAANPGAGWTASRARNWLSQNRLSPHHSGGNEFQLIPCELHGNPSAVPPLQGVRHQSGAFDLRNQ